MQGALDSLEQEAASLREQIKKNREAATNSTLAKSCGDAPAVSISLKLRRTLKGHLAKIYAMQWSQDAPTLASASQDGKLIVWNAVTCLKMNAINLPSNWVMTCAYSPSGEYVASGGLDNICSVWNIRGQNPTKVTRELSGHDGFLSCCRFIDNRSIVTSSGDHTCSLWDIDAATQTTQFKGHTQDVMFLSLNHEKKLFASGSIDKTIRVWDIRSGKSTHVFDNHEKDVNLVQFFPNDTTFASGSDDTSIRLFDIRAWAQINQYNLENNTTQLVPTSIAFSQSGRFLFSSYTDNFIAIWDTLKAEKKAEIKAHEKRVTSLGVSGDGHALCSASWDTVLKIWTSA